MSEREELADALQQFALVHDRDGLQAWDAYADVILAAGYRKPQVLSYIVVSRDGQPIGKSFPSRDLAQKRADEWTNDCRVAGVDWDYRVAEIVEATK
jgi:hypothetical protein